MAIEMSTITPIFIVGTNRSGTKWLSNILAKHPDVAAVQTERTQGIVETNMFHSLRIKFPDLRRPDDFVGLIDPRISPRDARPNRAR